MYLTDYIIRQLNQHPTVHFRFFDVLLIVEFITHMRNLKKTEINDLRGLK